MPVRTSAAIGFCNSNADRHTRPFYRKLAQAVGRGLVVLRTMQELDRALWQLSRANPVYDI